jgi:DNA-binding transcriptional ArsR family regulator
MTDEKEGKGIPFVKGSRTSADAAESMLDAARSIEVEILAYFMHMAAYSGATDDEIEVHLGLKHQTVSARRRQLERKGMVVKMYEEGKRVTRPTRSGRQAGVYISRRLYDPDNDPVVNPPVFYDPTTYHLVEQLKYLVRYGQGCVTELDGSEGQIRNDPEAIENMMNKLTCIAEDVKVIARRLWLEKKEQETFPQ